jgi:hypothetical protein
MIEVTLPNGTVLSVPTDDPEKAKIAAAGYYAEVSGAEGVATPTADATDTEQPAEAPKIDYETGVDNIGLRAFVARGDNAEEQDARLQDAGFSPEAISRDAEGQIILDLDQVPENVKQRYGIKGSGLRALDEKEGFTTADIAEFFSEVSGPLIGGVSASLAASGYGLPAAVVLSGAGSATGYLIDEGLEYAQGLRRESTEDLVSGAGFEFILGGAGEGVGRGLSALFGRVLKGPGGEEANAARDTARRVITELGGRPTVRGANLSPILGRLQAIYEGVFPNEGIARVNAQALAKDFDNLLEATGGASKVTKEEFMDALDRTITKIYGAPDDLVAQANKNLKNVVDTEIDKLLKLYDTPDQLSGSAGRAAVNAMEVAKRTFDEDVDSLYRKADELLGDTAIIPSRPIKDAATALIKKEAASGFEERSLFQFIKNLPSQINTETANSIRTALRHAEFDPQLVGTTEEGLIRNLTQSIDQAFKEAEVVAREATKDPTAVTIRGPGGKMMSRKQYDAMRDGFDMMRKAQRHYSNGIERFRQLEANKLFQSFKKSPKNFKPAMLLDETFILKPDDPTVLRQFLRTVVPTGKEALEVPQVIDEVIPDVMVTNARGQEVPMRDMIKSLPEDDALRRHYEGILADRQRFATQVAAARGQGASIQQAVRETMARDYLRKIINAPASKNSFGEYEPVKIAARISNLGETGKVLFGKDYDQVMGILRDLSTTGPRLTTDQLNSMAGRPVAEQRRMLDTFIGQQKEIKGTRLLTSLQRAVQEDNFEGVVNLIFQKDSPNKIRQAKELFDKIDPSIMENVRTLSLQRLIAGAGTPDVSSETFMNSLMSGQYSSKLETLFKNYGDKTLNEMFGEETTKALKEFAKTSRVLSDEPIKGLGALAPASIAASLGVVGMLTAPLTTLSTAGAIKAASVLLRSPTYLKLITRPTGVRPGQGVDYDQLGRTLEQVWEVTAQTQAQGLGRPSPEVPEGATQQTASGLPTLDQLTQTGVPSAPTRQMQQQVGLQRLQPVLGAPSQSRQQVSPILVPDPATRATFGSQ